MYIHSSYCWNENTPVLHHPKPKHVASNLPKRNQSAQWRNPLPFAHSYFWPHRATCFLSVPSCCRGSCTAWQDPGNFFCMGLECNPQLCVQRGTGGQQGSAPPLPAVSSGCLRANREQDKVCFAGKGSKREEKREEATDERREREVGFWVQRQWWKKIKIKLTPKFLDSAIPIILPPSPAYSLPEQLIVSSEWSRRERGEKMES